MSGASLVEGKLLAENLALGQRIQQLSPVLSAMAQDLAAARREATMLRRESAHLSAAARVTGSGSTSQGGVSCNRCGVAVSNVDDRLAVGLGDLVEEGVAGQTFTRPRETRTRDYRSGDFG